MNFGRGDSDVDAEFYSFVREVDYCSGALLATPRVLFQDLGGFAAEYRPGYYEDTDYCFRIRERGYSVYYQPETVVMHREGATAGQDTSQGMKQYQIINRFKFMNRWQAILKHQPVPPGKLDSTALQVLAIQGIPKANQT
jgi:GT2 family glycosyltransferase